MSDRELVDRLCEIPRGLKDEEVDWIEARAADVIDFQRELTIPQRRKGLRILRRFRRDDD